MSEHDRHFRDSLFNDGFAAMDRGDYAHGLESFRIASGAEHLRAVSATDPYRPETGLSVVEPIVKAARGHRGQPVDPAALVFMGSEAEFKGFIERRTGRSPDYRASGFVNHLGQAIAYYREAESMGYEIATERIGALRLKIGHADFEAAEQGFRDTTNRALAYSESLRQEALRRMGMQR